MARIASFLFSMFSGLFGWIGSWFGAKAALVATVASVTLAVTVALYTAIKLLVNGIVAAVPYPEFVMAFWAVWPSNADTCIAACFGADMAAFLYRYKVGLIQALAK